MNELRSIVFSFGNLHSIRVTFIPVRKGNGVVGLGFKVMIRGWDVIVFEDNNPQHFKEFYFDSAIEPSSKDAYDYCKTFQRIERSIKNNFQ